MRNSHEDKTVPVGRVECLDAASVGVRRGVRGADVQGTAGEDAAVSAAQARKVREEQTLSAGGDLAWIWLYHEYFVVLGMP